VQRPTPVPPVRIAEEVRVVAPVVQHVCEVRHVLGAKEVRIGRPLVEAWPDRVPERRVVPRPGVRRGSASTVLPSRAPRRVRRLPAVLDREPERKQLAGHGLDPGDVTAFPTASRG
jgi:hypothetical protein